MKKIIYLAALSTVIGLTACSKPTTEVKTGEGQTAAEPTTSTPAASLSTDNKADIQADVTLLQSQNASQGQEAMALQTSMNEAMQKQDTAQLQKLMGEFKTLIGKNNAELQKLPLKSSEVDQLRQKLIESSQVGLEVSEVMLSSDPTKAPDMTKLQPLQEKAVKAQQELVAIQQDIQMKLAGQAAGATAPQMSAPQQAAAQ